MPKIADVATLIANRDLTRFLEAREDLWFDAKRPPGYDLTTPGGRFELAKDVSSFLNAEGGHIVVGLVTEQVPDEQTERVIGLELLPAGSFDVGKIQGILNEYLYPQVPEVGVTWVEDLTGAGNGVGVISIPALSPDRRFVLINRAVEEGQELKRIFFGYAVRQGSGTTTARVDQIYKMCQGGRTEVAERLSRIESKLDAHLRGDVINPAEQQMAFADVARERVQRVLNDD